ncbi:MAG TPA: DUF2917 domain-containing protein [Anaerolineaceae bacterium]|nr:DUF2917 domain-containing protein [Anaerolineaceae bacterium]
MQSTILTTSGETAGSLVSHSQEVEIQLGAKDLFKLNGDARGKQITSVRGNLWVTQQGDPQDYLLHPGEKLKISRKGMILVQGTPNARLRISPSGKIR